MTRSDRLSFTALWLCPIVVATVLGAAAPPQVAQSVPTSRTRLEEMRHHFADVLLVHEAVIRGDLPAVRQPALRLAEVAVPQGMPETAAPFVAELRRAGRRAASAPTIAAAAQATVAMATACATCHRGMGVFPAASRPAGPEIGGALGHMLEHQRAADEMLIGLMVPATVDWRQGAERLRVAPLLPRQFPKDPKLTTNIRKLDLRVHELADQAIDAETADERGSAYAALLETCTQCHSLHSKIWGPGRGGGVTK